MVVGLETDEIRLNSMKAVGSNWWSYVTGSQGQTLLAVPFFVFMGAIFEKSGSGRATARRLRPADGPGARRRGAHRRGRRHDARCGHRRRRRHRDHDGHDLAAGDGPLRLRPQARHGRDRGLRHTRPADPAEPRAARVGFELQGGHGRRAVPRGDGPWVDARRAVRRCTSCTWRSVTRRRHRRCRSRNARLFRGRPARQGGGDRDRAADPADPLRARGDLPGHRHAERGRLGRRRRRLSAGAVQWPAVVDGDQRARRDRRRTSPGS